MAHNPESLAFTTSAAGCWLLAATTSLASSSDLLYKLAKQSPFDSNENTVSLAGQVKPVFPVSAFSADVGRRDRHCLQYCMLTCLLCLLCCNDTAFTNFPHCTVGLAVINSNSNSNSIETRCHPSMEQRQRQESVVLDVCGTKTAGGRTSPEKSGRLESAVIQTKRASPSSRAR